MTRSGSWFYLHEECCCEHCRRPRHVGGLCGLHFAGATAVERSIALLLHSLR